jgi:hypothetical protein
MNRIVKEVSTKLYAEGDAVITNLTLDFSGLTQDDILEIACQAAIVKWQSNARRGKAIPTIATYQVPKPGTRGTVQVTPEALVAKFGSIEQAIAQLEALKK